MELKDYKTEELIEELKERGVDVDDDVSITDLYECSDEELIDECTNRELTVYNENGDCMNDPMKPQYIEEEHLPKYYFIKRCYDSRDLREHLLQVVGMGGYVSNEQLIERIKELL